MFDPRRRDTGKRKGSLLSLASAHVGGASHPPAEDAWTRHRAARARREATLPDREPPARRDEPAIADSAPSPEPVRAARPEVSSSWPAGPAPAPSRRDDDLYWRPLIDPLEVIGGIWKSRWLIVATTIAGAALGVVIALSTPKVYEATAELLVDPRELALVDSELTRGGLPSDATLALVENQARVLTSRTVFSKLVDTLRLDQDPEFNGEDRRFSISGLIGGLRSMISFSGRAGDGETFRRKMAIEKLYKAVEVARGDKTFVISIHATTESPDKSALIANTLTDVFLQTYGALRSGTAGRATEELRSKLQELRAGVEEAERKVEAFKAENDLVDAQGRLIGDDEILKLNDQLTVARARTLDLDARAASARELTAEAVIAGNLPEQLSSPVLTEIRTRFASLRQQADSVATKFGPRHPQRIEMEAQVAAARGQIEQELRLVASSLQVELRRAVQLEQELASRLAQLKARQANVSEELVTLRELEREAAAQRAVYESILLRARETGEQQDINTANISVISEATPPLESSGTSRAMLTIMAAMAGFAAGVGIGGARGALDSLRSGIEGERAPGRAPAPRRETAGRREGRTEDESEGLAERTGAIAVAPDDPGETLVPAGYSRRARLLHDPVPYNAAQRRDIEEIRAGLAEVRDALEALAERRARDPYR